MSGRVIDLDAVSNHEVEILSFAPEPRTLHRIADHSARTLDGVRTERAGGCGGCGGNGHEPALSNAWQAQWYDPPSALRNAIFRRPGKAQGVVAVPFEKDDGGYDDIDDQDREIEKYEEKGEEEEEAREREEYERRERTDGCPPNGVPCPFGLAVGRTASMDVPDYGLGVRFHAPPPSVSFFRVALRGQFGQARFGIHTAAAAIRVDGVWGRVRGVLRAPPPYTCDGFDDLDRRIQLRFQDEVALSYSGRFRHVVNVTRVPGDLLGIIVMVTFPGLQAAGNTVRYDVAVDTRPLSAPIPEALGSYCYPT